MPNVAFVLYLVAVGVRRFAEPAGDAGRVVGLVASGALAWWAGDELLRGVNPWRRLLGAVVLGALVVGLVTR